MDSSQKSQIIRQNALFCLSNLVVGSSQDLQIVLSHTVMRHLLALAVTTGQPAKTMKELVFVIGNLVLNMYPEQIVFLLRLDFVQALILMIQNYIHQANVAFTGLKSLQSLIQLGESIKDEYEGKNIVLNELMAKEEQVLHLMDLYYSEFSSQTGAMGPWHYLDLIFREQR